MIKQFLSIAQLPRAESPGTPEQPDTWHWHVGVFVGYLLLATYVTWPLLLHMPSSVIQKGARPVDAGQGIWNLWWMQQALLHGQNPYITRYLFFPETINLFYQTLSPPNTILALPATLLAGPILAFNALTLLSFGLSGYATYRLVRPLVHDRIAAIVAGGIYAFSPYHMQVLLGGTLESIAIQWIPLYILCLVRTLHKPTNLNLVIAALALITTTLASYYYGIYCAIYTAFHILFFLHTAQDWRQRTQRFAVGMGIGLIWLLAFVPFVWNAGALSTATPEDWYARQVFHSVALFDLIAPSTLHPIWGAASAGWLGALHPFGVEAGASLGIAIYVLMLIGVVKHARVAWPWLALALALLLLALGPELQITGQPTGIPMPFMLLDYAEPLRNSSRPGYFVALWMLPVSVLAGYGVAAIRSIVHIRQPLLIAGAIAILVFELLPRPWPMLRLHVDQLYAELANLPERGAVLELPPDNDYSQSMLNQLCHGRPLAGGYLARTPDYPPVAYDSALQQLWYAKAPAADIFTFDTAGELATLGIQIVALNLDELSPKRLTLLRQQLSALGIERYAQDDHVELYTIDMRRAHPLLLPAAGWAPPETDRRITWRWMADQADTRILTRSSAIVRISFTATAYQSARPLKLRFDQVSAGEYDIPVAPAARRLNLVLFVPAGEHSLSFESIAQPTTDHRRLSLSIEQLQVTGTEVVGMASLPVPSEPTLPTAPSSPPCA
jgi:hypothetical protein